MSGCLHSKDKCQAVAHHLHAPVVLLVVPAAAPGAAGHLVMMAVAVITTHAEEVEETIVAAHTGASLKDPQALSVEAHHVVAVRSMVTGQAALQSAGVAQVIAAQDHGTVTRIEMAAPAMMTATAAVTAVTEAITGVVTAAVAVAALVTATTTVMVMATTAAVTAAVGSEAAAVVVAAMMIVSTMIVGMIAMGMIAGMVITRTGGLRGVGVRRAVTMTTGAVMIMMAHHAAVSSRMIACVAGRPTTEMAMAMVAGVVGSAARPLVTALNREVTATGPDHVMPPHVGAGPLVPLGVPPAAQAAPPLTVAGDVGAPVAGPTAATLRMSLLTLIASMPLTRTCCFQEAPRAQVPVGPGLRPPPVHPPQTAKPSHRPTVMHPVQPPRTPPQPPPPNWSPSRQAMPQPPCSQSQSGPPLPQAGRRPAAGPASAPAASLSVTLGRGTGSRPPAPGETGTGTTATHVTSVTGRGMSMGPLGKEGVGETGTGTGIGTGMTTVLVRA